MSIERVIASYLIETPHPLNEAAEVVAFAADAPAFMNRVIEHAGLPQYQWPHKERLPNSTRFPYSLAASKQLKSATTAVSGELRDALRDAFTPVIQRFMLAVPCLRPPWPVTKGGGAARQHALGQLRPRGVRLQRLACAASAEEAAQPPAEQSSPFAAVLASAIVAADPSDDVFFDTPA